jgi:DNA-binding response OmpR family regulator
MKRKISQIENPASTPPQHRPNPTHHILVVEDDRAIRRFNAEKLINSGYQVDTAEDGAAGWEALQLNRYHLLITNQHLPGVSGVELLHKIHTARMSLPVIMATRNLPTWEFALHPWLLPATMLLKPYTYDRLLGTVKNVLYATASGRPDIAPTPIWQRQPSAVGLQLR